jgi:hypothetical protein
VTVSDGIAATGKEDNRDAVIAQQPGQLERLELSTSSESPIKPDIMVELFQVAEPFA